MTKELIISVRAKLVTQSGNKSRHLKKKLLGEKVLSMVVRDT